MSPMVIAAIAFAALILTLLTGLPVTFSLFGLAALFIIIFAGPAGLIAIPSSVFAVGTTEIFIAIPLFIFMACLLQYSGIAATMFDVLYKVFGGIRGGLAVGTVVMCTMMAAMTGLGATGVVTMGLMAYPEMAKRGYNKQIGLGCIAPAGALGPIIPPSAIMIVIAGLAAVSVGKMFMGGVFPGLIIASLFIAYILARCGINPKLAPAVPLEERVGWGTKIVSLVKLLPAVVLIVAVLGSIYAGIATPTEAAGVGAFGALVLTAANRRLSLKNLKAATYLALRTNAMVMWLLVGGMAFAMLLGMTGVRHAIADTLIGLAVAPFIIIVLMQLVGLILGMLMDPAAISIICIPIFIPIVAILGYDPLWFCIVFALNMVVGYVTPPFGVNLFYTKGIVPPDITMGDVYLSSLPYVGLMMVVLILSIVWPPLVTWLPEMMI